MNTSKIVATLVLLLVFALSAGPATASDLSAFTARGFVESLNVVSEGGTGSVVQAALRLSVLANGANSLTFLCKRGGNATTGFTVGPCATATTFNTCADVSASIAPREDGSNLNDSQFLCASGQTCVEVSGFILGAPQTDGRSIAVIDTAAVSTGCSAR